MTPVEKSESTDSGDLVVGQDEVRCGRRDTRWDFLEFSLFFLFFWDTRRDFLMDLDLELLVEYPKMLLFFADVFIDDLIV